MKTSTNSNYLFSGEHYEEVTDLSVPGRGLDFIWARKYRSRLGPTTALGNGWDYSYNIYLTQAGFDLVLHDGNTRADFYSWNGIDRWTCPEFFRELFQNPDLTYTLVFPDHGRWNFYPFNATPVQGKLMSIVDRNMNAMQFLYGGAGLLNVVLDSLGRPYTIAYNGSELIESVTDFSGRQVQYEYYGVGEDGGSPGDLKSVTLPLGKTTTYTYTKDFVDPDLNHDLLTVTDPKGQVYLQNVYAHTIEPTDPRYTENPVDLHYDHIVQQIWGRPWDTVDIYYVAQVPDPANNYAVIKAIVNDRMGNVKEFFYDDGNRLVVAREYTGRAPDPYVVTTEVDNRPTGKLRLDDPDYFDAWHEYNGDSLVTRTIYPNGNEETYTYDETNPDRRSQGNLLEHCKLPGPLGGDQPFICETFEYESEFGGCCGNFVTRHVDFRGNETLHDYDGNGNRTHTTHRLPAAVEDWEYNAYGQATAHTWPDNGSDFRRRDENSYYNSGPQTGYLYQTTVDVGGFALTTTYEYDPVGNVIRQVDARGNDTLYDVNQLNQVVRDQSREVTPGSGDRYELMYYYDENNNLVQVDVQNRDEAGNIDPNDAYSTTLYEYDVLNYLHLSRHEVDETRSIVTEYEFDANRNCSQMRFGECTNGNDVHNELRMRYDERDLPFWEVRAPDAPEQSTTQFDYDGNTNPKRTSRGLEDEPRISEFVHDGYNRLITQTDAMGNVTSQHYDENGNRISIRTDGELVDVPGSAGNIRLSEAAYTYDEMDRLTVEEVAFFDPATQLSISDGFATTVTDWSPNSRVLSVTNDNGHTTVTTYDTANRPYTTTDAKGNTITRTYDENSNETLVTSTEKSDLGEPDVSFYVRYTYDGLDRRIGTTNCVGTTTESGYDSRDNVTLATDGGGSKSRYSHDGCDRRYNSTYDMDGDGPDGDGADIVILQSWDDSSRLTSLCDENGNFTQYAYDSQNRLIGIEYADGTAETAEYDVHDNGTKKWDNNGSNVQSFFDICNRPTDRTITPGPGVSDDTTFEVFQYDGQSRMIFAADDDSTVTRSHDSLSNITAETINGQVVTTVCDGVGNLLDCTYPSGREVTRTYDGLGWVSTISDLGGPLAEYSYIGPDRVERADFGNGTRADYAYDGILPNPPNDFGVKQIVEKRHSRIADGSVIDNHAFTWNRTHSKTSRQDLRAGGPGLAHEYGYDPGYRLTDTGVTTPGGDVIRQTGYELDGVGNRTSVANPPQVDEYFMDDTEPEPADHQMNQYTGTGFDYRQYDANGNLIAVFKCLQGDVNGDFQVDITDVGPFVGTLLADGPAPCAVDLNEDGLVDGLDVQPFIDLLLGSSTQVPDVLITYDYRNQMVWYYSIQKGVRHLCSYDALGRRIGKVVDADGSPVETRYYYLGELVIEEQDALGSTLATYVYGPHVDEVVTMYRGGIDYYFHGDDLNSVMAVTDASGAVVERYEYGDYGEPTIKATVREPNRDEVFDSDIDPGPSGIAELIADSFQFTQAATITGLTWWGGYSYQPGVPAVDHFTVRIYADSGGQPGSILREEAVGPAQRRLTGQMITSAEGDVEEYEYSARLGEPFTATGGAPYWLCVFNDTTGHPTTWGWESSTTGDGDVVWSHNGGPWGHYPANAAFELITTASAVGNPYMFTGREYDSETGLYYYRTRYLDSAAGRFTSRDTIGIWGDIANLGNGYTYVGNNPATHTDPTGQQPLPWIPPKPVPPIAALKGFAWGWGLGGFGLVWVGPGAHPVWWWGNVGPPGYTLIVTPRPGPLPPPPARPPTPYRRRGTGIWPGPIGPLNCGQIEFVVNQAPSGQYQIDITGFPGAVPMLGVPPYSVAVRMDIAYTGTFWTNTNFRGEFRRTGVWLTAFGPPFFVDVWYQDPRSLTQIGPCRIQ